MGASPDLTVSGHLSQPPYRLGLGHGQDADDGILPPLRRPVLLTSEPGKGAPLPGLPREHPGMAVLWCRRTVSELGLGLRAQGPPHERERREAKRDSRCSEPPAADSEPASSGSFRVAGWWRDRAGGGGICLQLVAGRRASDSPSALHTWHLSASRRGRRLPGAGVQPPRRPPLLVFPRVPTTASLQGGLAPAVGESAP